MHDNKLLRFAKTYGEMQKHRSLSMKSKPESMPRPPVPSSPFRQAPLKLIVTLTSNMTLGPSHLTSQTPVPKHPA